MIHRTQKALYSWFWLITVERYTAKSAKEVSMWSDVLRKPRTSFLSQWGCTGHSLSVNSDVCTVLSASHTRLGSRLQGFYWGVVLEARNAMWRPWSLRLQTPKESQHPNSPCLYRPARQTDLGSPAWLQTLNSQDIFRDKIIDFETNNINDRLWNF